MKPVDAEDVRGIWIWGGPGTGKSHHARHAFGDSIYLKAQNKWFDGYAGEKIIILDDLDTPLLSHHLKIWADRYACKAEVKQSTVWLHHTHFIVTSNFSIEQLFADSPEETKEAIKRRFKVIHFTGLRQY